MITRVISYSKVAFFSAYASIKLKRITKAHGLVSAGNFKNIKIGSGVVFNPGVYIQARGSVEIGSNVVLSRNACIFDASLDIESLSEHIVKPVIIGDDCWIGANATIVPGIKLGSGIIVAAGSVVTKSFDDNVIIGGNPAIILKRR